MMVRDHKLKWQNEKKIYAFSPFFYYNITKFLTNEIE